MMALHLLALIAGLVVILWVLSSAIRTFLVPRGLRSRMTRAVFVAMRYVFDVPLSWSSQERREQALAYYSPVALLALPVVWLACLLLAYTAIFWTLNGSSLGDAFTTSRLSLLYIGSNVE